MGQNILSSLFTVTLTILSLGLPCLAGFLVWWALHEAMGAWVWFPAGLVTAFAIAVEVFGLLSWLGRVFERTESIA